MSLGVGDLVSKVHTVGSVLCPLTSHPEQSLVEGESRALSSHWVQGADFRAESLWALAR